jgi:hypothetical protein
VLLKLNSATLTPLEPGAIVLAIGVLAAREAVSIGVIMTVADAGTKKALLTNRAPRTINEEAFRIAFIILN